MTNGFALNHDKSLQIYFFCVKRQAKIDFLKDVESTVGLKSMRTVSFLSLSVPSLSMVQYTFCKQKSAEKAIKPQNVHLS